MTLVLYTFHKFDNNVDFFLKTGIFYDEKVTFIIIINDHKYDKLSLSVYNKYSNLHFIIRKNQSYDFGAWNAGLFLSASLLKDNIIDISHISVFDLPEPTSDPLYQNFQKFIFLNSSVTGPFIPSYVPINWVDCFTSKLDDNIKLIGISINHLSRYNIHTYFRDLFEKYLHYNPPNFLHMQSMAFATDIVGLNLLIKNIIFAYDKVFPVVKNLLIILNEVPMSSIIMNEGYSLFSFVQYPGQGCCPPYKRYTTDNLWVFHTLNSNPLETIFVKNNTHILYHGEDRYREYSLNNIT